MPPIGVPQTALCRKRRGLCVSQNSADKTKIIYRNSVLPLISTRLHLQSHHLPNISLVKFITSSSYFSDPDKMLSAHSPVTTKMMSLSIEENKENQVSLSK